VTPLARILVPPPVAVCPLDPCVEPDVRFAVWLPFAPWADGAPDPEEAVHPLALETPDVPACVGWAE
jgi:hypothetical protein